MIITDREPFVNIKGLLLLTYIEWYLLYHFPCNFPLCRRTCTHFCHWLENLARSHDTQFAVNHMVSKYKSAVDFLLLDSQVIHFAVLQYHVHFQV